MIFHPDVLACHAQFGGDLESMQKCYDWPNLKTRITALEKENAELIRSRDGYARQDAARYQEARRLAIEECANVAYSIQPPKSIGRDHGRHHMAGAQAAARAIRARLASSERSEG